MKVARPTVAEERWLLLASRYPALRAEIDSLGHGGSWKTTTPLGRLLGVILTLLAMALLGGALSPFRSPWFIAGLLLMFVAEGLIARRRVYRSGIEEVLYVGGAVAVVVQILDWSNGNNDAAGLALVVTAVLFVGWRLLNPVLTTLAAAGYSLAISLVNAHLFDGSLRTLEPAIYCGLLATLALIGGGRRWQRPSHDFMLDGLVIVMPFLGGAWLLAYAWRGDAMIWTSLAVTSAFFAILLAAGLMRRQHAPLIGALGSLLCAGYALHELLSWPGYWQLITAGGVLLLLAAGSDRRLKGRDQGVTSRATDDAQELELLQLAGAASLGPAQGPAPAQGVQGQGGDFGGGGASGRF